MAGETWFSSIMITLEHPTDHMTKHLHQITYTKNNKKTQKKPINVKILCNVLIYIIKKIPSSIKNRGQPDPPTEGKVEIYIKMYYSKGDSSISFSTRY